MIEALSGERRALCCKPLACCPGGSLLPPIRALWVYPDGAPISISRYVSQASPFIPLQGPRLPRRRAGCASPRVRRRQRPLQPLRVSVWGRSSGGPPGLSHAPLPSQTRCHPFPSFSGHLCKGRGRCSQGRGDPLLGRWSRRRTGCLDPPSLPSVSPIDVLSLVTSGAPQHDLVVALAKWRAESGCKALLPLVKTCCRWHAVSLHLKESYGCRRSCPTHPADAPLEAVFHVPLPLQVTSALQISVELAMASWTCRVDIGGTSCLVTTDWSRRSTVLALVTHLLTCSENYNRESRQVVSQLLAPLLNRISWGQRVVFYSESELYCTDRIGPSR